MDITDEYLDSTALKFSDCEYRNIRCRYVEQLHKNKTDYNWKHVYVYKLCSISETFIQIIVHT